MKVTSLELQLGDRHRSIASRINMLQVSATLMLLVFMLLMFLLLLLVIVKRRSSEVSRKVASIPGPTTVPIFGNALQIGTNGTEVYKSLEKWTLQYGSPFKLHLGPILHVYVSSPEDIETVFGKSQLLDKPILYDLGKPWVGNGLATCPAQMWPLRRKLLNPAFSFSTLKEYLEIFNKNASILVDVLKMRANGPAFPVHEYMTKNAFDNIYETAMGLPMCTQKQQRNTEYLNAVQIMANIVINRNFQPWLQFELLYKFSITKRKQDRALKIIHGTARDIISQRRKQLKKEVKKDLIQKGEDFGIRRRHNLIDILINSNLTDEEIREEVDTFTFTGHETSSHGMSFVLWMLAWHQDIQEKVYEELMTVWTNPDLPLTLKQLQELKFLDCVVKETLRLYTVGAITGRKTEKDIVLNSGQVIPKEAEIMCLNFMVHKDPKVFPNPNKFDPDRFLPENIKERHSYAYITFGAGPRNCIGMRFAMLEIKCTVVHVLQRYKVLPGSASPIPKLNFSLVLGDEDGFPLRMENRSPQEHLLADNI